MVSLPAASLTNGEGTSPLSDGSSADPNCKVEVQTPSKPNTTFTYSGDSASVPSDVHKVIVRPMAISLPNRFCEKRHGLHQVILLEHEASASEEIDGDTNGITNDTVSTCRLKVLGDFAFAECLNLSRLKIPATVETVSKNALSNCKNLVQVDLATVNARLKHIGFCSFYQCTSLMRIHIPSTVEEIDGHAFHGCVSLEEVKLMAYFEKKKTELRLGSLILGPSVFLDCSALQSIHIPASLEKLPKMCFQNCSALRVVSLPEGLLKIKANSFIDCASLEYVRIPSTVQMIQRCAFKGCKALEAVDFGSIEKPSILKEMEWEAFMHTGLRKVKIPSSLEVVKSSVFYGCTSLVDVELAEGVKEIQHSAFGNCSALQAIVLPQSTELIGIRAFCNCPLLVTVEIPPTGMAQKFRIRKDAFVHCKAMINVSLPDSLTEEYRKHGPDHSFGGGFGENGFHGCTWLQEQYGSDLHSFLMGDVSRYGDDYPIHKLCYHSSVTTVETLRRTIEWTQQQQTDQVDSSGDWNSKRMVDNFGMTPFHVLLTAGKRRVDLLEVLLEVYPSYTLGWEDITGKKAIEYCFLGWNWTLESMYMLQLCLDSYVTQRLTLWGGIEIWDTDLGEEINAILSEDNNERQQELWQETFAIFKGYEQTERITVLELALWKREIMDHSNNGETSQDAVDREVHRARCGSSFLIPNVVDFLKTR